MWKWTNSLQMWAGKPGLKRHERLSLIWEDNIEMGLTGTEW